MNVKVFDKIPDDAIYIRKTVFMQEQGFSNEFDEIDNYSNHLVLYDEEKAIATARYYVKDDEYIIGRIAVQKEYRGKHIGVEVLKQVEEKIRLQDGNTVKLLAQYEKKLFYEKQGYIEQGDIEMDEECPHIWMYKELKK